MLRSSCPVARLQSLMLRSKEAVASTALPSDIPKHRQVTGRVCSDLQAECKHTHEDRFSSFHTGTQHLTQLQRTTAIACLSLLHHLNQICC